MKTDVAVMVNLLGVDDSNCFVEHYSKVMANHPIIKFHSYEKAPRQGRKMGHLTAVGSDWKKLVADASNARDELYRGGV
jgi:5-(carboxyamino)imidazole ribonucleotide synthase